MTRTRGRVLVAMSGGVDSSLAAALLLRDGYDVVGCFMRLGSPDEDSGRPIEAGATCGPEGAGPRAARPRARGCCSVGDAHDARLVAAKLGIPLYVMNFRRDFGRIMDYFVAEHAAGRTPNPCIRCNDWLKFGRLHEHAAQIGARFVATGHHARIVRREGRAELWRGVDAAKDQSYVLFGIRRDRLASTLLPVGEMTKADVRAEARRLGLPTFDKPDSQEICFVPDGDHARFVELRSPGLRRPGRVIDADGRPIGEHAGHHRFTIGQRRGLGVAVGRPIYVVGKDPATNTVTVGDRAALATARLSLTDLNWHISDGTMDRLSAGGRVLVQTRAHGAAHAAEVRLSPEFDRATVVFDAPIDGAAPGQAAVLYDQERPERVLGGGWIVGRGNPIGAV